MALLQNLRRRPKNVRQHQIENAEVAAMRRPLILRSRKNGEKDLTTKCWRPALAIRDKGRKTIVFK